MADSPAPPPGAQLLAAEGFSAVAAREFGGCPAEVLAADILRRRQGGQGNGAIVLAWRVAPPGAGLLGSGTDPPPVVPSPAPPPLPDDGPTDAEIADCAALSPAARASWRRRFWDAPPSEREAVLATFRATLDDLRAAAADAAVTADAPAERRDPNLTRIWQAALGTIQAQTTRQEFDTWLRGTTLIALDGGTATVGTSSPFHKEGLEARYLAPMRRALGDVLGRPVQARIVVADE